MQKGFLLSVTIGFGFATGMAFATDKGVYGDDDRKDLFDRENSHRMVTMAKSTAAIISTREFAAVGERKFKLSDTSYGETEALCRDEAFHAQPAAAHCSSFLVAPDVMVSAGHCFMQFGACETSAFVFDYAYYSKGDDPLLVDREQIYTCDEILDLGIDRDTGMDYAIIRLDRKVRDRAPLKVNSRNNISTGDKITVIGNPSGLPTKIAAGANVRHSRHPVWFMANLDTFHGNSGSAVFNDATGQVEGILVRGDEDFKLDQEQGCRRVVRCADDGCQGEAVTKISAFHDSLAEYL